MTVSLVNALSPRMSLVAQAMAERVDNPGAWRGYRAYEELVGRFTKPSSLGGAPTVDYFRSSNPKATVTLGFLEMTDVQEIEKGPATVIEDGIEERRRYDVSLKHEIKDTRTISHTFERTESFSDAYSDAVKKAWEAGGKASLSAEYAGIKGAVEAWGKYGEEASRSHTSQHGVSETTRDTISETFEFTGPIDFEVEAYRAKRRETRIVRARCDFDGKIYWSTGDSQWSSAPSAASLSPIAERIADDSIYGYDEFMRKPLSDAEITALKAPSEKVVEFPVTYDNIIVSSLNEV